jgi:hypothetical protein
MRFFWPCAASLAVKVRELIPGQSGCKSKSKRWRFVRNRETLVTAVGAWEGGLPVAPQLAEAVAALVALAWIVLCGLAGARVDRERVIAAVFV